MIKRIIISITAALLCMAAPAQTARELIEQDITRIGCQLHRYESAYTETAAPRGYKPFYVSHFSRHGSRCFTGDTYKGAIKVLSRADSLGILTDEGRSLLRDITVLRKCQEGRFGALTPLGGREHRGIAERLVDRCPEMFCQEDRKEVLAISSTVTRCQESMDNFCAGLAGRDPSVSITTRSDKETDAAITRIEAGGRSPEFPGEDDSREQLRAIMDEVMDVLRMESAFFTDPDRARSLMKKGDSRLFFYELIQGITIGQCLDDELPDLYSHFTFDELYGFWLVKNPSTVNTHGFTYENGKVLRRCGKLALTDILTKADEAVQSGSHKLADLRFSHDGGVLPLISFLGLEKNDTARRVRDVSASGWYAFQNIEMATNLQMIFYRNRRGKVLVKFLHNERETTITALRPYRGPYYRWSELRPYLLNLLEEDCG